MAGGFSFEEASTPTGEFSFDDAAKPSDVPSFFKDIARQVGLTARAGLTGLAAIPNTVASLPAILINAGRAGTNALLDQQVPPTPTAGEYFQRGLTAIGLPEPSGSTERVAQDVAGGMAGAGAAIKGAEILGRHATGAGKGIADIMTQGQGLQIAGGGTGGAGIGLTREMGGGEIAQTAAGMAAGAAPYAGIGLAGGTRAAVRGNQAKFQDTVGLYERGIGVTPSVGQASGGSIIGAIETGLSRFPGGNVPMIKLATKEQTALGNKVERLASTVAPAGTKMSVGKMIEEGITGPGGYMEQVKAKTGALYDKLDDSFGTPDYPVQVTNTQRYLDSHVTGKAGAENLLRTLQNARIVDIKGALDKDLIGTPGKTTASMAPPASGEMAGAISLATKGAVPAGTSIPFSAWKDVRSRIGELIGDPQLTTDIPRRQLRGLYSSMSRDIEAAAATRDAELVRQGLIAPGERLTQQAVSRANTVTKLLHDRIDNILQPVMNAGGPERIYNAALSGTKDGDTVFRGVMRALPQEGKDALTADIFRRLGKATGQNQTAEGNAFSTERFLTQWSNLSPEAKRTLTIGLPASFKNDLDDVVQIADRLRQGSSTFKNPSGTGQAMVGAGIAGGAASVLLAPLTGFDPFTNAVGMVGSTYGAARVLTSPAFVHWLAKATRAPNEMVPVQIQILGQITRKERDAEMKAAMESYLEKLKQQ